MSTANPPVHPLQNTGALTVDHDRNCVRCSYNLRGLPIDGKCPECGSPIADSLKGILLQFASPEYLQKVAGGLSLILNGILLMVVAVILSFALVAALRTAGAALIGQGLQIIASVMMLIGYWKYTEPDPGFIGTESPGSARSVARIAVLASLVILALQTALGAASVNAARAPFALAILLLALASTVAAAVQFFAIMRYTRWVAGRVPDAFMVRRTRTYMWLLPVLYIVGALVIVGPLIALVMYWNLLDRLRKHLKSIRSSGSPAALPKMAG